MIMTVRRVPDVNVRNSVVCNMLRWRVIGVYVRNGHHKSADKPKEHEYRNTATSHRRPFKPKIAFHPI